jgi:hypothetical protein
LSHRLFFRLRCPLIAAWTNPKVSIKNTVVQWKRLRLKRIYARIRNPSDTRKTKPFTKEPTMTFSHLPRAMWVAFGLGLAAAPIVSTAALARPAGVVRELVNRPYAADYYAGRDATNYDREVNGSDASTPGAN